MKTRNISSSTFVVIISIIASIAECTQYDTVTPNNVASATDETAEKTSEGNSTPMSSGIASAGESTDTLLTEATEAGDNITIFPSNEAYGNGSVATYSMITNAEHFTEGSGSGYGNTTTNYKITNTTEGNLPLAYGDSTTEIGTATVSTEILQSGVTSPTEYNSTSATANTEYRFQRIVHTQPMTLLSPPQNSYSNIENSSSTKGSLLPILLAPPKQSNNAEDSFSIERDSPLLPPLLSPPHFSSDRASYLGKGSDVYKALPPLPPFHYTRTIMNSTGKNASSEVLIKRLPFLLPFPPLSSTNVMISADAAVLGRVTAHRPPVLPLPPTQNSHRMVDPTAPHFIAVDPMPLPPLFAKRTAAAPFDALKPDRDLAAMPALLLQPTPRKNIVVGLPTDVIGSHISRDVVHIPSLLPPPLTQIDVLQQASIATSKVVVLMTPLLIKSPPGNASHGKSTTEQKRTLQYSLLLPPRVDTFTTMENDINITPDTMPQKLPPPLFAAPYESITNGMAATAVLVSSNIIIVLPTLLVQPSRQGISKGASTNGTNIHQVSAHGKAQLPPLPFPSLAKLNFVHYQGLASEDTNISETLVLLPILTHPTQLRSIRTMQTISAGLGAIKLVMQLPLSRLIAPRLARPRNVTVSAMTHRDTLPLSPQIISPPLQSRNIAIPANPTVERQVKFLTVRPLLPPRVYSVLAPSSLVAPLSQGHVLTPLPFPLLASHPTVSLRTPINRYVSTQSIFAHPPKLLHPPPRRPIEAARSANDENGPRSKKTPHILLLQPPPCRDANPLAGSTLVTISPRSAPAIPSLLQPPPLLTNTNRVKLTTCRVDGFVSLIPPFLLQPTRNVGSAVVDVTYATPAVLKSPLLPPFLQSPLINLNTSASEIEIQDKPTSQVTQQMPPMPSLPILLTSLSSGDHFEPPTHRPIDQNAVTLPHLVLPPSFQSEIVFAALPAPTGVLAKSSSERPKALQLPPLPSPLSEMRNTIMAPLRRIAIRTQDDRTQLPPLTLPPKTRPYATNGIAESLSTQVNGALLPSLLAPPMFRMHYNVLAMKYVVASINEVVSSLPLPLLSLPPEMWGQSQALRKDNAISISTQSTRTLLPSLLFQPKSERRTIGTSIDRLAQYKIERTVVVMPLPPLLSSPSDSLNASAPSLNGIAASLSTYDIRTLLLPLLSPINSRRYAPMPRTNDGARPDTKYKMAMLPPPLSHPSESGKKFLVQLQNTVVSIFTEGATKKPPTLLLPPNAQTYATVVSLGDMAKLTTDGTLFPALLSPPNVHAVDSKMAPFNVTLVLNYTQETRTLLPPLLSQPKLGIYGTFEAIENMPKFSMLHPLISPPSRRGGAFTLAPKGNVLSISTQGNWRPPLLVPPKSRMHVTVVSRNGTDKRKTEPPVVPLLQPFLSYPPDSFNILTSSKVGITSPLSTDDTGALLQPILTPPKFRMVSTVLQTDGAIISPNEHQTSLLPLLLPPAKSKHNVIYIPNQKFSPSISTHVTTARPKLSPLLSPPQSGKYATVAVMDDVVMITTEDRVTILPLLHSPPSNKQFSFIAPLRDNVISISTKVNGIFLPPLLSQPRSGKHDSTVTNDDTVTPTTRDVMTLMPMLLSPPRETGSIFTTSGKRNVDSIYIQGTITLLPPPLSVTPGSGNTFTTTRNGNAVATYSEDDGGLMPLLLSPPKSGKHTTVPSMKAMTRLKTERTVAVVVPPLLSFPIDRREGFIGSSIAILTRFPSHEAAALLPPLLSPLKSKTFAITAPADDVGRSTTKGNVSLPPLLLPLLAGITEAFAASPSNLVSPTPEGTVTLLPPLLSLPSKTVNTSMKSTNGNFELNSTQGAGSLLPPLLTPPRKSRKSITVTTNRKILPQTNSGVYDTVTLLPMLTSPPSGSGSKTVSAPNDFSVPISTHESRTPPPLLSIPTKSGVHLSVTSIADSAKTSTEQPFALLLQPILSYPPGSLFTSMFSEIGILTPISTNNTATLLPSLLTPPKLGMYASVPLKDHVDLLNTKGKVSMPPLLPPSQPAIVRRSTAPSNTNVVSISTQSALPTLLLPPNVWTHAPAVLLNDMARPIDGSTVILLLPLLSHPALSKDTNITPLNRQSVPISTRGTKTLLPSLLSPPPENEKTFMAPQNFNAISVPTQGPETMPPILLLPPKSWIDIMAAMMDAMTNSITKSITTLLPPLPAPTTQRANDYMQPLNTIGKGDEYVLQIQNVSTFQPPLLPAPFQINGTATAPTSIFSTTTDRSTDTTVVSTAEQTTPTLLTTAASTLIPKTSAGSVTTPRMTTPDTTELPTAGPTTTLEPTAIAQVTTHERSTSASDITTTDVPSTTMPKLSTERQTTSPNPATTADSTTTALAFSTTESSTLIVPSTTDDLTTRNPFTTSLTLPLTTSSTTILKTTTFSSTAVTTDPISTAAKTTASAPPSTKNQLTTIMTTTSPQISTITTEMTTTVTIATTADPTTTIARTTTTSTSVPLTTSEAVSTVETTTDFESTTIDATPSINWTLPLETTNGTMPATTTTITVPPARTEMEFKMTLDIPCDSKVENVSTVEYQNAVNIFYEVMSVLGNATDISVLEITNMRFKCGSIIGSGVAELPGETKDTSKQVKEKFNEAVVRIPEMKQYNVQQLNVSDVNECETNNNCHALAKCTNHDPGYSCRCSFGNRDKDPTNPGTRCEDLCQFDGRPYCKNSGSCTKENNKPVCNCTSEFVGTRCEFQDHFPTTTAASNATSQTTSLWNVTIRSSTGATNHSITNASTTTNSTYTSPLFTESATIMQNRSTFGPTDTSANVSTVRIPADTCGVQKIIKGFTFPPTRPGITSYSTESCPEVASGPRASILCSVDDSYDMETFKTAECRSIEAIIDEPYSNTTMEDLQFVTANISTLEEDVVSTVSEFLDEISNTEDEFSEEEVADAAEVVSHLTEHYREATVSESDEERVAEAKQDLVQSITQISRKIDSGNSSSFTKLTQDVNIEVVDVKELNTSYVFETTFYEDETSETTFSPMTITLSPATLQQASSTIPSLRIVSVGFRSSALFPSEKKTDWVISVSLGNSTDSVDGIQLAEPIVIRRNDILDEPGKKRIDDFKTVITVIECVFWDFKTSEWSEEGCTPMPGLPISCECTHLTNFAILVTRTEVPSDAVLGIVTHIGCGLSIAGLVFTFIIICVSRRMRKKYQMRILGNICFCLAIALAIFAFGVDSQADPLICSVLAALMQFFFLTTWFWMAIYSFTIYRDIVQVIMSYGQRFKIRYAAAIAYGIPTVIVAVNAGVTLGHIDQNQPGDTTTESSYRARNFCWLQHHSLYFGFLLPVGLLLLFNLIVFGVVIPKVTCRRAQIQSSRAKQEFKQKVAITVSLATTMGLSWIFGYLMLISDNPSFLMAMSWLFTIVNSLQGLSIFYFAVVRTGELRRVIAPVKRRLSTVSTSDTQLSSRKWSSTYSRRTSMAPTSMKDETASMVA